MNRAVVERVAAGLGVLPFYLENLCLVALEAGRAQEAEHNTGADAAAVTDRFDLLARSYGLDVDWRAGLYPRVARRGTGEFVDLPLD